MFQLAADAPRPTYLRRLARRSWGPGIGAPKGVPIRLFAVAFSFGVFALLADILPRPGLLTPPRGGFEIQVLWFGVALAAAWRPLTRAYAWLVVLSAAADVIPELSWINNDLLWTVARGWSGLGTIVLAHLIVACPTGRLRTQFDRRLMVGLYTYWLIWGALWALSWAPPPGCYADGYCPSNPLNLWANPNLASVLSNTTALLAPMFGGLVIVAVARRWRSATPVARRILIPAVVAIPLSYADLLAGSFAQLFGAEWLNSVREGPLGEIRILLLPGLFLVGVLRAQLGTQAVGDLALRLGQGPLIPHGTLREALAQAMSDPTLEVLFPAPSGVGFVDASGEPTQLPEPQGSRAVYQLEDQAGLLAAIVYDPAVEIQDAGRLERVAAVARLAVENERLAAQVLAQLKDVRESRARIVQAGDDERRRVERDLHDGAQQRLVALTMRLQLARDTVSSVPTLVDSATAELEAAIREVRTLARGLYPTILSDAGLAAGLETLAEQSTVPVRVTAPARRFEPSVEAAAYYVVAEGLTNMARHSGATSASVTVTETRDGIVVVISDDGRGGADRDAGTGLRGLSDRVAALGGTLVIDSPTGGGTTLTANLPNA